jgi:hypothetical protein
MMTSDFIGAAVPGFWEGPWPIVFFVILLFAVFIGTATPPRSAKGSRSAAEYATQLVKNNKPAAIAFILFFWVFLLLMAGIAIWAFFFTNYW